MEAGKATDAFGLLPGHEIQVADGESAYTTGQAWRSRHMGSIAQGSLAT